MDSVVIVGGQFTLKDVSRYNEDGFVEALPSLAIGGGFKSCAGYINDQNKMVIHYIINNMQGLKHDQNFRFIL